MTPCNLYKVLFSEYGWSTLQDAEGTHFTPHPPTELHHDDVVMLVRHHSVSQFAAVVSKHGLMYINSNTLCKL